MGFESGNLEREGYREDYREVELLLRGAASMRFHPNRRASIDQRPGPNMARAPAMVPSNSQRHLSPDIARIFPPSASATEAPAMGVHKPKMRKMPQKRRTAENAVMVSVGSPQNRKLAWTTSTEPRTSRIRSKAVPGQPAANVEYRRRNTHQSSTLCRNRKSRDPK